MKEVKARFSSIAPPPFAEHDARIVLDFSAASTAGRRVLVIEDDHDTAALLREALELAGHAVDVAYDSTEGLTRIFVAPPDAVLCDLELPGLLTSFGLARSVRRDARFDGMLLIALTGHASAVDRARAREAGFDLHLVKPADLGRIERSVLTPRPFLAMLANT